MYRSRRFAYLSAAVTALSLLMPPAYAVGMRPMRDMPFVQFSEQDRLMLRDTLQEFLNDAEDGGATEWQNPETGNGGEIKVTESLTREGASCRRVWMLNRAGENSASGSYVYCKDAEGYWKVLE